MKARTPLLLVLLMFTSVSGLEAQVKPGDGVGESKDQPQLLANAHQLSVRALVSEREKLKAGKSSLFVVLSAGKELRDVELKMSATAPQRVASLSRYQGLLNELEPQARTALEQHQLRKAREEAEADLLRARSGR